MKGYKGLIYSGPHLLLIQDLIRKDGVRIPIWDLPGGRPEENELPKQTVARELEEETGLVASVQNYVGSYDIHISKGKVTLDVYACTPETYQVNILNNPAPDEYIVGHGWFTPRIAEHLTMSDGLREFIRGLK